MKQTQSAWRAVRSRHASRAALVLLAATALCPFVTSVRASAAMRAADAGVSVKVAGVRLTVGVGSGDTRTYEATVFDTEGRPVGNADLDLGGLGADPDLRVPTTPMKATGTGAYAATVRFPADGDWVLVVRVHEPTQVVDLFTEKITGAGAAPSHEDLAAFPSRRAVLAADPTFYQRYDPTKSSTGTLTAAQLAATADHGHLSALGVTESSSGEFDPSGALVALLHTIGAAAWIASVVGLVLANRIGESTARSEITRFVAEHYALLAIGGLALLVATGLQTALSSPVGLTDPRQLLSTGVGTAYLAVFSFKMVAVTGSVITSVRIRRLLPSRRQLVTHSRLASAGAMANADVASHRDVSMVYRLAETNALLAASIIGCVVLLGQLAHALH